MILFPYAGDTRGGSVHSSFLLIEELIRRGRSVQLAFHGQGFAHDLARERGFSTLALPPLGRRAELQRRDGFRLGNLTAAPSCYGLLRERNISIVHVNDKRMLRTWCIPSWFARRPLLAHWRSVYTPNWPLDIGLSSAARIVCVSQYSRDRLPVWAQAKSEVVYNPFNGGMDDRSRAAARERIRQQVGIPADAAVVGIFGALLSRKRPHLLLKILERIPQTAAGKEVYGIVCGESLEPRDQIFFDLLNDKRWQRRVVNAGYVTSVLEWMAACDVMIAPAIDEPLARVGVEAQSVGLPIIVSSDGGLREVTENGVSGLVVNPDDFEGWVSAVRRVLDEPAFANTLSDGGRRAAAQLTVARHVDAIEHLYDDLLYGSLKKTPILPACE